jgi:hypothetical protein
MKLKKAFCLLIVLIITSPVTIAVWMVSDDKTLLGTFNEIIEANR